VSIIRSRGYAQEFALEDRSNLEDRRFDGLRTFHRFLVFTSTQNCVREKCELLGSSQGVSPCLARMSDYLTL